MKAPSPPRDRYGLPGRAADVAAFLAAGRGLGPSRLHHRSGHHDENTGYRNQTGAAYRRPTIFHILTL
jgi:hypothetical protein